MPLFLVLVVNGDKLRTRSAYTDESTAFRSAPATIGYNIRFGKEDTVSQTPSTTFWTLNLGFCSHSLLTEISRT